MPLLYGAHCERCGREAPGFTHQYARFLQDNGEELALPHPIEDSILRPLGWSLSRASAEGRLRVYTAYLCPSCGSICHKGSHQVTRACQMCGGTELHGITEGALLRCPSCGERSCRLRAAGIS